MASPTTSGEARSTRSAAAEAWSLMVELSFSTNKPRLMAISQEYDLSPMQLHALRALEPGLELTMSALAGALFFAAPHRTGIVGRLPGRGGVSGPPPGPPRRGA